MTLLVIGSSGQVAQSLQERDARGKAELVALGRPDLDLNDTDTLKRAFDAHQPKLVINAAAYTAVDAAETDEAAARSLNATGPQMLAELCAQADAPLIHLSTDYVFNGAKDGPYDEKDAVAPLGVYGQTKLDGETAIEQTFSKHIILRTAWVYSPFGKNFIKTMLRLAEDRNEVSVVADQIGNPTSALHIADALLEIADQICAGKEDIFGLYHLAGTGSAAWADVAEAVFASSRAQGGPSAKVNRITSAEFPTPTERPANSQLNTDKLKSVFGIRLPDWQTGVEECVQRLLAAPVN